jgi:hypothetical protein
MVGVSGDNRIAIFKDKYELFLGSDYESNEEDYGTIVWDITGTDSPWSIWDSPTYRYETVGDNPPKRVIQKFNAMVKKLEKVHGKAKIVSAEKYYKR